MANVPSKKIPALVLVLLGLFAIIHILLLQRHISLKYKSLPVMTSLTAAASNEKHPTTNLTSNTVKILVWKSTYHPPSTGSVGRITRLLAEMNQENGAFCRNQYGAGDSTWSNLTCQFTLDTKVASEVDAVSFYMFNSGYKMSNLPQTRRPNQLWVSFVQEAPTHSGWVDPLKNLFNWTMSYRSDSEIWSPYGRKLRLEPPLSPEKPITFRNITLDQWIQGKDRLVAGVISNCRPSSGRDLLIKKMNKSGEIDIYGGCGNKKMGCNLVSNYNLQCGDYWHKFASRYKFFLAFENSLCRDYITEKFWRSLEVGMVPVVYGSGYYRADAPPYSYIDAREFHSAGQLMKFLKRLAANETLYASYFEWRREYMIEQKWSRGYCNLCKAVWEHKTGKKVLIKVYENLKQWWRNQPGTNLSACEKPQDFYD